MQEDDDWDEQDLDAEGDDSPDSASLDSLAAEPPSPLTWLIPGVVLVALLAGVWVYVSRRPTSPSPKADASLEDRGRPAAAPAPAAETSPPKIDLPPLSDSDSLVREWASRLSTDRLWPEVLRPEDLVRKLVVIVANVSEGKSPARQLGHIRPEAHLTVLPRGAEIVLDPESYHRYDSLTVLFASLDADGAARFYRTFEPLFDEAHRELGLADRKNFRDTLAKAISVLLETPVVEVPIRLRAVSVNYAFDDRGLEDLAPAQKHLLRMGPANTKTIQAKLVEFARALGLSVPGKS